MSSNILKTGLIKSALAASALLFANGLALADSAITLTAVPTTTTLPDGQTVNMWGYSCGAPATAVNATCTAANGTPQTSGWQPPLITVPGGAGNPLTITLINSLTFGTNTVPTSLVIVGQLGGGLGAVPATMPSPAHAPQGTSWPGTRGDADASSCLSTDPLAPGAAGTFCPPHQADRVRSFGTEVNVSDGAAGKTLTWANLRPGTYLIESGTEPSIQGPMGLYGVLVVTEPPTTTGAAQAYGQTLDKDVPLLLSEIDPVQNAAVTTAVNTTGFNDTRVWNGQPGQCGDPAVHSCYPPAVNYDPRYYLINGVSFDRTVSTATVAPVPAAGTQTRVLLRFVNAGLRMHVPSVVGANLTLLAEDGNKLPGLSRVQSEVFLAAGKTYDVTIAPKQTTAGTYDAATYAVFDRALGLSTNNQHDGGMQAYIQVAGGATSGAGSADAGTTASANPDNYFVAAGNTLTVSDPAKGVVANDLGIYGVAVSGTAPTGLKLNSNGTFTYSGASPTSGTPVTFGYCGNGATAGGACSTVTLNLCAGACLGAAPVAADVTFTSNITARYASPPPGLLGRNVTNASGLALTAVSAAAGVNLDGSFTATGPGTAGACSSAVPAAPAGASCVSFPYQAKNSQGALSNTATATIVFLPASNITVNVYDAPSLQPGKTPALVTDYRWIIEEDRTFWVDPKCQINTIDTRTDSRGLPCPALPVESLGYNFHTANMPVVAEGCVGDVSCERGQSVLGQPAVCDIGNGACRTDAFAQTPLLPGAVHLDPNKRYYISVLPGDGENTTLGGAGGPDDSGKPFDINTACGPYTGPTGAWEPGGLAALCGHGMGGAPIAPSQTTVSIGLQETPLPTAKIAVFVFEDDNPLNGENDAGGGVDILAPNEPGLGGFELKLFDQAGGLGDATGQITYDMFNMPVSNSLAGTIDPVTGKDACPITKRSDGMVGMIPTCPKFESDGKTMSPLAGQALIANLYPGLYEVVAAPAADRIGRGEEWLQTNTLDGGKAHEAFIKPNEPGYFQEFGPGGFHVAIGFANPKIINDRRTNSAKTGICDPAPAGGGLTCGSTINVQVTNARMSRTPDQRIYSSGDYGAYGFTQCYLGIGPAGRRGLCVRQVQPGRHRHVHQSSKGRFQAHRIRPVERHHARRAGVPGQGRWQHRQQGVSGYAVADRHVHPHVHRQQW